jgi:lipoate-protein ligase A
MEQPERICLYRLGATRWTDTQAIVCALAHLGREGVVLSRAVSPCLCAGGQVNLDQVVDQEFCGGNDIPVFRRETRNATICMARSQLELQMVLSPRNPLIAGDSTTRCGPVLEPLFETCRSLLLDPAYRSHPAYKSPYEIVVGGRRIASACTVQIHQHVVLAASLTLDFDAQLFAQALNIPSPELQTRVVELARARRTSLQEELGQLPAPDMLEGLVCQHLQPIFGVLPRADMDALLCNQMEDDVRMFSPARARAGQTTAGWTLDIGAGTALQQCAYRAPGGFLRATCEWQDDRIARASISGDFFSYPPGALYQLEQALVGVRADQVTTKIHEFYRRLGLVTPGIHAVHWAKVLVPAQRLEA